MLSATKHLGHVSEILSAAKDDTPGGSLLRLILIKANEEEVFYSGCFVKLALTLWIVILE